MPAPRRGVGGPCSAGGIDAQSAWPSLHRLQRGRRVGDPSGVDRVELGPRPRRAHHVDASARRPTSILNGPVPTRPRPPRRRRRPPSTRRGVVESPSVASRRFTTPNSGEPSSSGSSASGAPVVIVSVWSSGAADARHVLGLTRDEVAVAADHVEAGARPGTARPSRPPARATWPRRPR